MKKTRRTRLTVMIKPELKEQLQVIGQEQERSVGYLVEQAVAKYLDKYCTNCHGVEVHCEEQAE